MEASKVVRDEAVPLVKKNQLTEQLLTAVRIPAGHTRVVRLGCSLREALLLEGVELKQGEEPRA